LPVRHRWRVDRLNMRAVEESRWGRDHRMMRAGKAEDAMRARRMIGIARRQLRCTLAVVHAELESRRAVIEASGQGETAKRDQQALGGNRIGDDDTDKRPPEPSVPHLGHEHAATHRSYLNSQGVK